MDTHLVGRVEYSGVCGCGFILDSVVPVCLCVCLGFRCRFSSLFPRLLGLMRCCTLLILQSAKMNEHCASGLGHSSCACVCVCGCVFSLWIDETAAAGLFLMSWVWPFRPVALSLSVLLLVSLFFWLSYFPVLQTDIQRDRQGSQTLRTDTQSETDSRKKPT